MRLARRTIKKARIEIIPMIDTIFFLLVFFMISTLSMSRYSGLPVNLPKAATGQQPASEVPPSRSLRTVRSSSISRKFPAKNPHHASTAAVSESRAIHIDQCG